MKQTPAILLCGLVLLSACNGSKSSTAKGLAPAAPNKPQEREVAPPVVNPVRIDLDIDATIDGQYLAVFDTLNPQITTKITGAFTFSRDKSTDELVGDVRITNAGAELLHSQYVRLGTRCPGPEDDTNGDGIIDAVEGEAVYGKIYFPLDGDLSSQSSHDGEFPVGDIYGNYIYAKVTTFTKFIQDLRGQDEGDGYFRLKDKEPMDIEGRAVVVHGVDKGVDLPATVGSVNRFANYQTLPIACGVIKKVLTPPGTIDTGTYPTDPGTTPEPEVIP